MLGNPKGKFETLVSKLLSGKQYEIALQEALKIYRIRQYHITQLVPNKIIQIQSKDSQSWYQNQLRVFIWLLVGYAHLQKRHLSELGDADWQYFSSIFNYRNADIFEFQSKTIIKKSVKCTKWDKEEVDILDSLIKSKTIKNKWNQIAKELFIISNKRYFRTAKQCRQHWINHLNPSTVRSSWSLQEDLQLMETILKYGKKWSQVSKILGGKRTEHMVKNRFKSLYHFESKRFQKKGLDERQKEVEVIEGMIIKLKCNIEESDEISQVDPNKELDDRSMKDEEKIFEDDDYEINLNEGGKSELKNDGEIWYKRKRQSSKLEEQMQNFCQVKMNEFVQQDYIYMFFEEECIRK